jgi:hypothetical protein
MSVVRAWDVKDTIDGGLRVWHEEPVMHGEQHAHHHVSHVLLLPRGLLLVSRLLCAGEAWCTVAALFAMPTSTSSTTRGYGGMTVAMVDLRSVWQEIHDDNLYLDDNLDQLTVKEKPARGAWAHGDDHTLLYHFPQATTR